jgi:DNA-binding GntR family transcriptional regulator
VGLGQVISRRKIAAELGMSFLPVSIALLRLEFEGLLESRPRAGTRVRIPSPDDVRGHYVVREALEVEAAKLFAQVATPRERAELKPRTRAGARCPGARRPRAVRLLTSEAAFGARRTHALPRAPATIEQTNVLASMGLRRAATLVDPKRRHEDLIEVLSHDGRRGCHG